MAHFPATVQPDGTLELPYAARQLVRPGQVVDVDVPDLSAHGDLEPNHVALRAIEAIKVHQHEQPHSPSSDSLRFLREGREGDMYGYDANE